jgi:ubiquinol-cytochrome c reductase cytochrome b subunit
MAGYSISSTTLARFYALHVIIPLLIAGFICVHIFIVHKVGSTSGSQVRDYDKISFHPYFTVKDFFGVFVSLVVYFYLVFYEPNLLGHTDNYIEANPMVTPPHIVPE